MSEVALDIRGLSRRFKSGDGELVVLDGVDLAIERGQIVGLVGPSGSGKSSLLHAAGLLETPTSGEVRIGGVEAWALSDKERTRLRRTSIGFVYQFHHLLPEFDALDNVAMPLLILGRSRPEARVEATRLLSSLGLAERLHHRPAQLSGGEQQRVAISRALANGPAVLLADEPTGNLDPQTSAQVFQSLLGVVRTEGAAALIATHNLELTRFMDRVVSLENGRLVEQRR
ncbi:MAG: ABC transporter ATP-binding protein [Caulobacterales bacterium]|jgi:lipoprotein-releasing system ATP-binding protein